MSDRKRPRRWGRRGAKWCTNRQSHHILSPVGIEGNPPPGPFGSAAPEYAARGLRVFPTDGPDGKRPCIRGWRCVGSRAVPELARKFPDSNVGLLDGHTGGVTRIDIDDPAVVDPAIKRFGDTPIKVGTPSGGLHLWYRANGERRTIGLEGEKIDVLGWGGYGLVPPSVNPRKGVYRFLEGSLDALHHLPTIRPGALPPHVYGRAKPNRRPGDTSAAGHKASANDTAPIPEDGKVREGTRDLTLFAEGRRLAQHCETEETFVVELLRFNLAHLEPPFPDDLVLAKAAHIWGLKEAGKCFVSGGGRKYVLIQADEGAALYSYPPALALWHFLRANHASDHTFAISPRGLAKAKRLPYSENTIAKARDSLLTLSYVARTHKGGSCDGDADLFRFGPKYQGANSA